MVEVGASMNNRCPSCRQAYQITPADVGQTTQCTKCGASLSIQTDGLHLLPKPAVQRWPALARLAWWLRAFAVLSLLASAIGPVACLVVAVSSGMNESERMNLLLGFAAIIVGGLVACVAWMGLAELLELLIALESHARETRDRLPKHQPEQAPAAPE
jgi:hypothetical protein